MSLLPLSSNQELSRIANILPAFALALCDKIGEAMRMDSGRSPMAIASLVQLRTEPGLSTDRLRSMIGLSHSATVRIIDQLEREGLVSRRRQATGDARVSTLDLTDAGLAEAEHILAARKRIALGIVETLSRAEIGALESIISKTVGLVVRSGLDQDVVCRLCDLNECPQDRCPVNICVR